MGTMVPVVECYSPCSAWCVGASAQKFAQWHCSHRVNAQKFAQHTKNGSKWVVYAELGELLRGNAAGGAELGEYFRVPAAVGPRRASLLRRVPGTGALLLAPLTLQCAAKPYGWHGGQPAQVATYRVYVRVKGFTRAGCVHRNRRGPDGSQASRRPHDSSDTTEAGPRRIPPLVARCDRTVGTDRPRYQQHVESYNPNRGVRTQIQRTPGN